MNIFQLLKTLVNRCCFWRRRKEKKVLLETLQEYLEQDFLTADNFYQARCTAHISLEEYSIEKINAERREKERQEKARREAEKREERARHEAEKRLLLKSLREHL